jgi:hypothetical protein
MPKAVNVVQGSVSKAFFLAAKLKQPFLQKGKPAHPLLNISFVPIFIIKIMTALALVVVMHKRCCALHRPIFHGKLIAPSF